MIAPNALHVDENINNIVNILSTSGQFKSKYLTADASVLNVVVIVAFPCSPRGLQTHVAFNTRAGVHSNLIRCARCTAAEMQANMHATNADIASNALIPLVNVKQTPGLIPGYSFLKQQSKHTPKLPESNKGIPLQ